MSGPMVSMVTMVTRYTGGLSQLPVVEMSWGKNLRKNLPKSVVSKVLELPKVLRKPRFKGARV